MASLQSELGRLLADSYLEGVDSKPLDEIRAMRAECQEAEVAVSYLRRLAQGRLDIVNAYLGHDPGQAIAEGSSGADGDSGDGPGATVGVRVHEPPDLAALVEGLPAILTAGPGRPPGPGRMMTRLAPDTEESGLTADLDSVMSADDIGRLRDLTSEQLTTMAEGLHEIERRVSSERRGLHHRIDTLQAELVDRYKSGQASVDGLLS
ncbi:MAG: RsiG family protein [Acidimicrobiales bacterium]